MGYLKPRLIRLVTPLLTMTPVVRLMTVGPILHSRSEWTPLSGVKRYNCNVPGPCVINVCVATTLVMHRLLGLQSL